MKTIKIIGGGLSGLTLGIALRRSRIPVELFEPTRYPRHRVCGEFINGLTNETAKQLGIEDLLQRGVLNRSVSWFRADQILGRFNLPRAAVGLSRYSLDAALAKRFQSLGGRLIPQSVSRGSDQEDGSVWCTGRVPNKSAPWIGLKCHLSDFPLDADLEMHLGSNAYVGVARIEENLVNMCGLFHKKHAQFEGKGRSLIVDQLRRHGLNQLAQRARAAQIREGSFKSVSGFALGAQEGRSDVVAIGDHHAVICPFTGNGMTMAMEGAALAAPILESFARGTVNWDSTGRKIRRALSKSHSGRVTRSLYLQPFLFEGKRRDLLEMLIRFRLLPFNLLWRYLH